ncbi:MAG: hypothetical protein ACXWFT_05295 [Actinomycetota bacterium]
MLAWSRGQELLDWQDYVAWIVLIAPTVAFSLVFWRVKAVRYAIVGTMAGLIVVSLTMPLGGNAEAFGLTIGIGLVGGALLGAVIGALLDPSERRTPRDASVRTIGPAMLGGIVGALIGGFAPAILDASAPDLNVSIILAVAVGGGLGWALAAVVGWVSSRGAPAPSTGQRWIVAIAAMSIVPLGAGVVMSIQARAFGPSIDELSRWDRSLLPFAEAAFAIDTALAVVTLIAVALRTKEGAGAQQGGQVP